MKNSFVVNDFHFGSVLSLTAKTKDVVLPIGENIQTVYFFALAFRADEHDVSPDVLFLSDSEHFRQSTIALR